MKAVELCLSEHKGTLGKDQTATKASQRRNTYRQRFILARNTVLHAQLPYNMQGAPPLVISLDHQTFYPNMLSMARQHTPPH